MTQQGKSQPSGRPARPLTYYDILDLDRDATPEELKEAYHRLAREYHPDVASKDEEVAQKFAAISEAYRVLSDPQQRYRYDRTLPQKSYPLRHPTPEKIWREATDVVLVRSDRFGPLNQAMQAAVPIVLDEDVLVVTMPGAERHLAGHLETAANRNAILNALEEVAGSRVTFKMIDGSTVQDWELIKAAQKRARGASATTEQETTAAPAARAGVKAGEGPWDKLLQEIHRQFQQLAKRQYPQSRSRYLREALTLVLRTDEELRLSDSIDEEAHERSLARALERLASMVEVPPVLLAMEFDRMKRAADF
jgi:hypothetical protein